MNIDDYQEARDRRDLAVAEALGIDPATCANLEVDHNDTAVYWDHIGPKPHPKGAELADEQESGAFLRLRRRQFTIPEWESVRRADDEWLALFPRRLSERAQG